MAVIVYQGHTHKLSRVQLLHLNNNNATASGASALFRNMALPSPLQLQVQSVQLEDVFITSRGTRVARELADLQQDHQSSLDDDAAAARIGLEKARERSSKVAAGTATGHGVYKSDVQAHLIGGYDGDGGASGRWSCLECLEMRGNNVGAGCEKDLLEMLKGNMSLQVTCACLIPAPHFNARVFIVAAAAALVGHSSRSPPDPRHSPKSPHRHQAGASSSLFHHQCTPACIEPLTIPPLPTSFAGLERMESRRHTQAPAVLNLCSTWWRLIR